MIHDERNGGSSPTVISSVERRRAGQAHLPDQELIDLATLMLIDRLERLTATVVLRESRGWEGGLAPARLPSSATS